jgi:hypothetical protein
VKEATQLQLGHTYAERRHRMLDFVACALDVHVGSAVAAGAVDELRALLRQLWKLMWENSHKEVFWRLVLDGLPKYGGSNGVQCVCGQAVTVDRAHVFWDCCVAQAVLTELRRVVPGLDVLMREHVWLMRRPMQSLHEGVWRVVCLSAVSAMDCGHRLLHVLHGRDDVPPQQACRRAGLRAVACFWESLQDFVGLQCTPSPSGGAALGPTHPFIGALDCGRLRVNYPGV